MTLVGTCPSHCQLSNYISAKCFYESNIGDPGQTNPYGEQKKTWHGLGYPIFKQSRVIQPGLDGSSYQSADGIGEKLQVFDLFKFELYIRYIYIYTLFYIYIYYSMCIYNLYLYCKYFNIIFYILDSTNILIGILN